MFLEREGEGERNMWQKHPWTFCTPRTCDWTSITGTCPDPESNRPGLEFSMSAVHSAIWAHWGWGEGGYHRSRGYCSCPSNYYMKRRIQVNFILSVSLSIKWGNWTKVPSNSITLMLIQYKLKKFWGFQSKYFTNLCSHILISVNVLQYFTWDSLPFLQIKHHFNFHLGCPKLLLPLHLVSFLI